DHLALGLGVGAPEHEHQALALPGQHVDHVVGETLPAPALVRARASFLDGQHGIEQQHAAPGPRQQAAVVGAGDAGIALDLPEDVVQRGRHAHAGTHGETQAVRLAGAVIGVLAEHHHAYVVEGRGVEGGEDLGARREHARAGCPAFLQEGRQYLHVVALEPGGQARLPRRVHADAVDRPAHAAKTVDRATLASRSWNRVLVTSRRSSMGLSTRSLAPSRSSAAWFAWLASPVITSTGRPRLE